MKRGMATLLCAGALCMGAGQPVRADGFGAGLLIGALIGAPIVASSLYYPRYYYPPYYPAYYPYYYPTYAPYYAYAPTYAYSAPSYAAAAPAAPRVSAPEYSWYFCPASKSYYPYVRECPTGWQRVPTVPPGA